VNHKRHSGEGWALVGTCPRCGKPDHLCRCATAPAAAAGKPTFRLRMEKRRGKPVTILAAEAVAEPALKSLAKELKALCGTGGTLKDAEIELQGEHRERLRPILADRGYRVKG